MGYRYGVSFDCTDTGKRVSVRYRTPDGMATDVVGILEICEEGQIAVRDKTATLRHIAAGDLVAGKVVPSESWDAQDKEWEARGGGKPAPG